MLRAVRLLTFALTISLSHVAFSDEAESGTLKVITYNVQFLPGPAAAMNERKEPEHRAARIAEEVAKFDIVALEEVFDQKWVDVIANGVQAIWGERFHKLASPMAKGHNYTGGCLLLSKYPFVETNTMIFEHFSKPEDFGFRADGFAAKGVIHARVALDDESTVDVFVTHLEARDDSLRPAQYAEMAAFIQRVADPSRPALILGDLNTRGMLAERNDPASQYSVMMNAFNGARPEGAAFADVWPGLMGNANGGTSEQESTETGKRIDYILVSNPKEAAFQLTPKSICIDPYADAKTTFLSDHSAVIAEFTRR